MLKRTIEMQTISPFDPFFSRRPSFLLNTLLLIIIMLLYPVAGALLLSLFNGGSQQSTSLLHPDRSMIPLLRMVQSVGQLLMLALPVILLAAWHTGRKNPFCRDSLAFLGIRRGVDVGSVALAVVGIFLLQPLLYTIITLQDLYFWQSLGDAGAEVVRQRAMMDAFIKELALVRSFPEFLLVAFVLALTPSACEELLFRGYIQQNYTQSLSSRGAVVLTALVFAFFHLNAANLLPLALLGWYIGYIYSRTGNLAVPFFAHLANNLAALLFLMVADGADSVMVPQVEPLVRAPWWWLVVAVSSWLFVMIILRFSSSLPSESDVL